MRRENKLALIVGFSVLLVVAVLVSDHLSTARQAEVVDGLDSLLEIPGGRAFVEAPLQTEPTRIAARPDPHQPAFTTDPNDAPGSGTTTGPITRGPRSIVLDEPTTEQRIARAGPIEINNGSAIQDAPIRGGRGGASGLSEITGIDNDTIRELLRRQKPVLARPGGGTTPGERAASTPSRAERHAPAGHISHTNQYVIQPNDTLFEICERLYGDGSKWRELVAINKGRIREDGTVFPNVIIDLVPGASVERTETPDSTTARRAPSEPTTRSYTVKKGDTLSEIVQREVGSIRDLRRVRDLNPWLVKQRDIIRVGQTLTLPVARHASARAR